MSEPRPSSEETETRRIAGRYRLTSPLGSGAMGTVWAGYDEVLHRAVAIKELKVPPGVPRGEMESMRERMMREARTLGGLSHPNVITLYDVVDVEGDPFVVMELLPSRNLSEVIGEQGRLGPGQVASVGLAMSAALRAAHRAGITHRDVKPGNVLVAHDGRIKLTDFGIARKRDDVTMTQTGLVLGSPAYIAPEVASGQPVTPAADLWGLGATLFAAVEARPPYDVEGDPVKTVTAVVHAEVPRVRVGGPMGDVITALMVKEPDQRMSLEEVRRRLRPLLADPDDPLFPGSVDAYSPSPEGPSGVGEPSPGGTSSRFDPQVGSSRFVPRPPPSGDVERSAAVSGQWPGEAPPLAADPGPLPGGPGSGPTGGSWAGTGGNAWGGTDHGPAAYGHRSMDHSGTIQPGVGGATGYPAPRPGPEPAGTDWSTGQPGPSGGPLTGVTGGRGWSDAGPRAWAGGQNAAPGWGWSGPPPPPPGVARPAAPLPVTRRPTKWAVPLALLSVLAVVVGVVGGWAGTRVLVGQSPRTTSVVSPSGGLAVGPLISHADTAQRYGNGALDFTAAVPRGWEEYRVLGDSSDRPSVRFVSPDGSRELRVDKVVGTRLTPATPAAFVATLTAAKLGLASLDVSQPAPDQVRYLGVRAGQGTAPAAGPGETRRYGYVRLLRAGDDLWALQLLVPAEQAGTEDELLFGRLSQGFQP